MASRNSHTVSINGLEIHFPFQPYEIQEHLMSKVLECLDNGTNGLLESPTGTGKTLSLLCASLAWQQKDNARRRSELGVVVRRENTAHSKNERFGAPTIIYASRTHSQLSQAVRELKRSHYKSARAVVLGSRDLMCVHEEVSRLESSSAKIMMCHTKIVSHTCAYHNNVSKHKGDPALKEIIDIEDIVRKGKTGRFCPFFMSRELVKEADIVFMPYNYLLDPKLRTSHGIEIKNSIIILDEGHNITKICEDACSFEMKSSLLASCIQELTYVLMEYTESSDPDQPPIADLPLPCIVNLKKSFLVLEELLDKTDTAVDEAVMSSKFLIGPMIDSGFTRNIPRVIKELDAISMFLSGNSRDSSGCDKFGSILRILNSQFVSPTRLLESFRVCVQHEEGIKKEQYSRNIKDTVPAKTFQFWCLHPGIGIEMLTSSQPRSIILTSGTLSPVSFLVRELVTPFPVQLSNPHIITDKQLFASIIKCGHNNVRLSSTFQNRNDPAYLRSLGEVVVKVCSVVPKGVLIFFPSYVMLEICNKAWEKNGILLELNKHKKVLVEPRRKDLFTQVMDNYNSSVKVGGGCCLMAVCRGKVSEGLDFSDDNGRAVIITGIPYAPSMDKRVIAKQQYLDEACKRFQFESKRCMSGKEWYQLEAIRALNQAIGRIIRHAHDYGAILLCDERCDSPQFQENLSHWVRNRLKPFSSFDDTINHLAEFFGATVQKERIAAVKASPFSKPYERPSRQEIIESVSELELELYLYDDDIANDTVMQDDNCCKKMKTKKQSSIFNNSLYQLEQCSKEQNLELEAKGQTSKDKITLEPNAKNGQSNSFQWSKPKPGFNSQVPVFTKSFAAFSKVDSSSPNEAIKKKKFKFAPTVAFKGQVVESNVEGSSWTTDLGSSSNSRVDEQIPGSSKRMSRFKRERPDLN